MSGGPYQPHDAVDLDVVFELPPATPSDPDTVTFTVRDPQGVLTSYVFGSNAEVERTGVGAYTCHLGTLGAAGNVFGEYRYVAIGTGAVPVELPGTFVIARSNVAPQPSELPGPVLGPCQSWVAGADVASFVPGFTGDSSLLDGVAIEASMALYESCGRLFTGLCSRVVRPVRDACRCWNPASIGLGPWYWTSYPWGVGAWGWTNECGDRLGCSSLSRVRLPGYPVREVTEVKIDGVVLPPLDANGHPNYRLDRWRWLVRLDDPGPPTFSVRRWPGCQSMALDPSQTGTFAVSYEFGVDPPQLGRDAACQLAAQLWLARPDSGADCQLPVGTTRVVRQGVQVDRGLLVNWLDPKKPTGLVFLDTFIRAYWRPQGSRRPAVFSPDGPRFAYPDGIYS